MKRVMLLFILILFLVACTPEDEIARNQEYLNNKQEPPIKNNIVEPPKEEFPLQEQPPLPNITEEEPEETPKEPNKVETTMIARQWEFVPDTIIVNAGDEITIHVTSVDIIWGITIEEFGIDEKLTPGQTTTITFTPNKTGKYKFWCSQDCGNQTGIDMTGFIFVK